MFTSQMLFRCWLLILVLPLCACTAANEPAVRAVGESARNEPDIIVLRVGFDGRTMLPGATVVVVGEEPPIEIGKTDAFGTIDIHRSQIEGSTRAFIVVCADRFFCGALPAEGVLEQTEVFISLEPFTTF